MIAKKYTDRTKILEGELEHIRVIVVSGGYEADSDGTESAAIIDIGRRQTNERPQTSCGGMIRVIGTDRGGRWRGKVPTRI